MREKYRTSLWSFQTTKLARIVRVVGPLAGTSLLGPLLGPVILVEKNRKSLWSFQTTKLAGITRVICALWLKHEVLYKAHNKINEQFIQVTLILPALVDYPESVSGNNQVTSQQYHQHHVAFASGVPSRGDFSKTWICTVGFCWRKRWANTNPAGPAPMMQPCFNDDVLVLAPVLEEEDIALCDDWIISNNRRRLRIVDEHIFIFVLSLFIRGRRAGVVRRTMISEEWVSREGLKKE